MKGSKRLDSKVHGTLKIACASIVGKNWLPKVLKEFVTTYPDVKISLITGWSSEIVKALYDGEAHSWYCQRPNRVEREKNSSFSAI